MGKYVVTEWSPGSEEELAGLYDRFHEAVERADEIARELEETGYFLDRSINNRRDAPEYHRRGVLRRLLNPEPLKLGTKGLLGFWRRPKYSILARRKDDPNHLIRVAWYEEEVFVEDGVVVERRPF